MNEMKTHQLIPGVRLAKQIKGKNGVTILEKGTILTPNYIQRLKNFGVESVFIEEPGSTEPSRSLKSSVQQACPALLSPEQRESKKNNHKAREAAFSRIHLMISSDQELRNTAIPFREDRNIQRIREIFYEITSQRHIADEIGVLFQTDPFLFEHSMRVGLLAGVIGLAQNMDPVRLYELVLGALLFDIGMTAMPDELIRKKRKLDENEKALIRLHTKEGYRILTSTPGVPLTSAMCALLHHERYQGEGYPYGIKGKDVPEFAQIVGLLDLYNALTSPRHHRRAFTPSDAVEYLFAAGNYEFDMSLIWVFIQNIYIYPVSSLVQLSNGQIGIVTESGKPLNYRPTVKIIREADGSPVTRPYEIDLFNSDHLSVTGMFTLPKPVYSSQEYAKSPRN